MPDPADPGDTKHAAAGPVAGDPLAHHHPTARHEHSHYPDLHHRHRH